MSIKKRICEEKKKATMDKQQLRTLRYTELFFAVIFLMLITQTMQQPSSTFLRC